MARLTREEIEDATRKVLSSDPDTGEARGPSGKAEAIVRAVCTECGGFEPPKAALAKLAAKKKADREKAQADIDKVAEERRRVAKIARPVVYEAFGLPFTPYEDE